MSVIFRVFATICASLASSVAVFAQPLRDTQYVIISFDGAQDLAQWRRSRALAAETGATFTYFLSCVYLLSSQTRHVYRAPGKGSVRSNVGFAASKEDIARRLDQLWQARGEGHEIASHGCGHLDGANWSKADWIQEFDAFSTILRDAYAINAIEGKPEGWNDFAAKDISGFRAPYLSVNKALFAALSERNFAYEASGVSGDPAPPQESDGMVHFALPLVAEGPAGRKIIAMDYNLFVRHSGGTETFDKDSAFENRAYEAFLNAFEAQYSATRIPLQLGFHFTLMNDGAYWRALERFARNVCQRPEVACVSYRDYLERVEEKKDAVPAEAAGSSATRS